MNYFDLVFIIPLLWGAYKGFTKGLIVSVASLFALLLGIYGAIQLSDYTGHYVKEFFDVKADYLPLIAFAITFIGIVIGIHFVAKLINKLVDAIALGWLNTIAGILFGILKTAFILSIVVFFLEQIDSKDKLITKEFKKESLLYEPIKLMAPTIFPSLKNVHIDTKFSKDIIPQFPI